MAISLISLGIGLILFLLMGVNIFHCYLYGSSPKGKMAPTIMIGLTPTAILTIIVVKIIAFLIKDKPSFSLSWWAITFHPETASIATGALNNLLKLAILDSVLIILTLSLLTIWLMVSALTIKA